MVASTAKPRDWCAGLRALGVVRVAEAFGGRLVDESTPRHGLTPCPACKAETRHTKRNDKRGAVVLVADGDGWKCIQCDTKGDAVRWAAYATTGQPRANAEVRKACAHAGLLGGAASGLTPRPRLVTGPTIEYPPHAEVLRLLAACGDVTTEPQAAAWLLSMPLDTAVVSDLGAVAALPDKAVVPAWARFKGRPWPQAGYRLVAPLADAQGALRSVHARRTANTQTPKGLNPAGHATRGLVLACPRARSWSSGKASPAKVVVAEGLRDWLVAMYRNHAKGGAAATVGIVGPGSWLQAHADRVPDGCRVVVATDHDETGDKYAKRIAETLNPRMLNKRVRVSRWRPTQ
jgi:5S rRNA maturation endonuclease (ribonuclease M5)